MVIPATSAIGVPRIPTGSPYLYDNNLYYDYAYRVNGGGNVVGIIDGTDVVSLDSYGRFKLKFLIVYNGIEVGKKNSSSGYFIFFIKVH